MILKNILKKKKENTTQLIELSVNSWLLPLPYISIVVANVDELGRVDHVDCQTLLTNESNGATYTLPDPNHLVQRFNLWAAAHWWAADLRLVGRDQGWELRNFFYVSQVSQSMKRYQVLVHVVELELPLHTCT